MLTKAVYVKAPFQFDVRQVDLPDPGPDEALVRITACSVCGGDLTLASLDAADWQPFGHEIAGVVEKLGWNQYGGWRIGIRSHDKLRYYYYAHLRKGSPYAAGLEEGDTVKAGDVIGYMGMTGYSTKEDVNNVKLPHLHFGLQLIFDDSQIDGTNQIWIDVYPLVKFLERNRMPVRKQEGGGYLRADGLAQEVAQ